MAINLQDAFGGKSLILGSQMLQRPPFLGSSVWWSPGLVLRTLSHSLSLCLRMTPRLTPGTKMILVISAPYVRQSDQVRAIDDFFCMFDMLTGPIY
jgi:hypothetical protein